MRGGKMKNNKFKTLQKENEKLREKIDEMIGLEHPLYSPLWVALNELIENELQQEEMCNK